MRRFWWAMTVAVLVVGGVVLAAPAASAATLVASNPAPHQELSAAPGWVTLAFDDTITKSGIKILVLNSDGHNVAVGDLVYMGSSVMVQLDNDLAKGTYTVQYRLKNSKGVPEGGAFQFAYGQGKWTDLPDAKWSGEAEQPPAMANPDPQATEAVNTASPTTVPEVEVEKSDGTTMTPTPPPSLIPAESPGATPGAGGTDSTGAGWVPWVVGGGIIAAAAGGGAWWILKRRAS